jgi:hypothetical protein
MTKLIFFKFALGKKKYIELIYLTKKSIGSVNSLKKTLILIRGFQFDRISKTNQFILMKNLNTIPRLKSKLKLQKSWN